MLKFTRFLGRKVSAVAVATMMLSGIAEADVVLKYSNWIPPQHIYNKDVVMPWIADIERVTEGRVKIEVLPKTVGTAPEQYDVLRDGLADVSTIVPGYTPGRFDAFGLGEVPLVSADPRSGAPAFQVFYDKHLAPLNFFDGVHVLSAFTTAPGQVFTTKVPVRQLGDFHGLKIRSPVVTSGDSLQAVGAIPMMKPVPELYELLSGGVLDGTLAGGDQARGFRLSEVTKNVTVFPGGFYSSVMLMMINEDVWNRISPEDQKAITSVSGEAFAALVGEAFAKEIDEGFADMKAKGGEVIEASPEFVEELRKALRPVEDAALEKATKAGVADPAAALADLRQEVERREKAQAR